MMSGDSKQAIRDFNRAIELQPNFPQAYTNRGNAYLHLGRFGLAFADFRRGWRKPCQNYCASLCNTDNNDFAWRSYNKLCQATANRQKRWDTLKIQRIVTLKNAA